MKNNLITMISLVVCSNVFFSCSQSGSGAISSSDSIAIYQAFKAKQPNCYEETVVDLSTDTSQGLADIYLDPKTAARYVTKYSELRDNAGSLKDKLSKSVWFDKKVILLLADSIRKETLDIDGVRLHFISYESLRSADGQQDPNQVSIVITPTHPTGRTDANGNILHASDWSLMRAPKRSPNAVNKKDGLNHGQLCPTVCLAP